MSGLREVLFFSTCLCAQCAWAAEPIEITVTPYVWGSGIDGTLTHERLPLTLKPSASFGDVLDDLDAAGMFAIEGRRGHFGGMADVMIVRSSRAIGVPVGSAIVPIATRADTRTGLLAAQFRVTQAEKGSLDIIAGARYWNVDTRFTFELPGQLPAPPFIPRSYAQEQGKQWWDLQIGAKGRYSFANGLYVGGWGLFGCGGSRLATDFGIGAGYRVNHRTSVFLGYRHLAVDFGNPTRFSFDVALHGPAVGLELRL